MKTKNLNVRISSILVLLVLSFGNSALKAQLNYPVTNTKSCDVEILYEISDDTFTVCDFGTVTVPANTTILNGNTGTCTINYSDVHIILVKVGSYTIPGTTNNVGGPPTIITSQGTTLNVLVPPGNPCNGNCNMTWSAGGTTIN